ncbi:MAG: biopolymer transporter ExbD [Candidatus Eisenbacteria bacterium]|nr:biopolymer transporter ExbD [Candidatus Eisenbacteria bacterium]
MRLVRRKRESPDIPLASTADVAFLLLIFFIATTVFSLDEGLPLILPARGASVVKVSVKNVVRIVVHEDGTVTVDKKETPVDGISGIVRGMIAENDKLVVSLETHPRCRYGRMVRVLDQLKLASATRISLRLFSPETG